MARPRSNAVQLPVHVHKVHARGREYYSYHPFRGTKRAGLRVALPGCPTLSNGEPNQAWWEAYRAASGAPPAIARPGTFAALADVWRGSEGGPPSPEWLALAENTKRNYRTALKRILAAWGDLAVRGVEPRHVLELRDKMRETPQAANTLLTALSSMMNWSIPRGWRDSNPCDKVRSFPAGEAWLPWPNEAIMAWRELASPEMRQAAMLALYTGQRRGDLLPMLWADVDRGVISVIQEKTRARVWVPIHRDLKAELDQMERRAATILTGERGKPFTVEGFKSVWGREMEQIRLLTRACDGLVFHGLRKSAVCCMLEAGCSVEQVQAITGQSRQMVYHYAAELDRKRLGEQAMAHWEKQPGFVVQTPHQNTKTEA